jgi:hypothetical protein
MRKWSGISYERPNVSAEEENIILKENKELYNVDYCVMD